MIAQDVRRGESRALRSRRVAFLVSLWFGANGLAAPDPAPPDPGSGPPGRAAPASRVPRDELRPDGRPAAPDGPAAEPAATPRPPRPETPRDRNTAPALLTDEEFATRRRLNHVLYRDQRYRLLLTEAEASLARGEPLAASEFLIQITRAEQDVFLWSEATGRPESARTLARRAIDQMTPTQRAVYDRYIAAAADAAFVAAVESGSFDALCAIPQEFPGTAPAARARRLLARQFFDAGRYAEAAAQWQGVFSSPVRLDLTLNDYLQAAAVSRIAAGGEEFSRTLGPEFWPTGLASELHTLSGRTQSLGDWSAEGDRLLAVDADATSRQTSHWLTPAGGSTPGRGCASSLPYPVPLWSSRPAVEAEPKTGEHTNRAPSADLWQLAEGGSGSAVEGTDGDVRARSAREWIQSQLRSGESALTATAALIVGDRVLTRGIDRIEVRDLLTGERQGWRTCRTSLAWSVSRHADSVDGEDGFNQTCAENALLATLTSNGSLVFCVDSMEVSPAPVRSPGQPIPEFTVEVSPSQERFSNRVMAYRLPQRPGRARNGSTTFHGNLRIDRADAELEMAWSVGGPATESGPENPLAGHFFLGPPVPVGGLLLVLSEYRSEIQLVVLEAESGKVQFLQGLALADRPVSIDRDRLRLAFLPAVADGIALCPTPCGVIAAYDLNQRSLRWVAQYRPMDTYSSSGWRGDGRGASARLAVQPVTIGAQVLLLPPDAGDLCAWRLSDGALLWNTPRRGAHQILEASADTIVLVSSDRIACCDRSTGDRLWERTTPPICGQGLTTEAELIVPLAAGSLMVVDLRTGQPLTGGPEVLAESQTGAARSTPLMISGPIEARNGGRSLIAGRCLGNLAASRDWIVSTSPAETSVMIGAESLRRALAVRESPELTSDSRLEELHRLTSGWGPVEHLLRSAEVALLLGDEAAALPQLQQLLAVNSGSEAAAGAARPRARVLLRELLYMQLSRRLQRGEPLEREDVAAVAQLGRLADTEVEQARWQLLRLRSSASRQDIAEFLAAAREVASLPADCLVPSDAAGAHSLAPATMLRSSWERLLKDLAVAEREALSVALAAEHAEVLREAEPEALSRFALACDGHPLATVVRLLRAEQHQQAGRLLAAEAELLQLPGATAARVLEATGRGEREPRRIDRLPRMRSITQVAYRPESPAAAQRDREVGGNGTSVTLRIAPVERPSSEDAVPLQRNGSKSTLSRDAERSIGTSEGETGRADAGHLALLFDYRRELTSDPRSEFRLLHLGDYRPAEVEKSSVESPMPGSRSTVDDSPPLVELAIVRRRDARPVAAIAVPARSREPALALQPVAGGFLPLADSSVHGLSLLDGALAWTARRNPAVCDVAARRDERLRIGPSGPGYCLVQTPEGLCCLDPVTGGVRWQRVDVATDCGLFADEEAGLYGDSEVLVLLESDLRRCRLLSTKTGELLGEREIPVDLRDARRRRMPFGRRLFFVTDTRTQPRYRLWDANENRIVLDIPAHPRLCDDRVHHHAVACLSADFTVQVIDTQRGEILLQHEIPVDLQEQVTGIRVWRDVQQWCVYVAHSVAAGSGSRCENASTEVQLPSVQVNGTLSVYSSRGRMLQWSRTLENRTVLTSPLFDIPFLVAVSRPREELGGVSHGLCVEAFDRQTGDRVAMESNVDRTRLVHATHDADSRTFRLVGEQFSVEFCYAEGPAPLVTTAEGPPRFRNE